MANLTDGTENEIVDGLTGVSTLFSTTMSLALFSADPTDAGVVTNELTGGGYARKTLATHFGSAVGGTSANTTQIDFVTATADWTTATYIGFMESDVEGTADMKAWALLSAPQTILNGNTFSIAIGDLTVTAD